MTKAKWCEGWTDIDFIPATRDESGPDPKMTRPAIAKGGLCIHRPVGDEEDGPGREDSGWVVSHVRSGRKAPGVIFIDQAVAKEFAEVLLGLCDFDCTFEELEAKAKDEALGKRVREVLRRFRSRDDEMRGIEEESR